MRVPLEILKDLWEREDLSNLNLEMDRNDVLFSPALSTSKGKRLIFISRLTREYLVRLEEMNLKEISLYYDKDLIKLLRREYPREFPPPKTESVSKITEALKLFELANKLSSYNDTVFKKRFSILLQDVLTTEYQLKKIVLPYYTIIDSEVLSRIKILFSDEFALEYINSERGILLIYDKKGYKKDPELIKLQFKTRKLFDDIEYKNIIVSDAADGFRNYFAAKGRFSPKLVLFCGKTAENLSLARNISIFDPFVKIDWLAREDLGRDPDTLFLNIVRKLGQGYYLEYQVYSKTERAKLSLPASELLSYRRRIGNLSRDFRLKKFFEIAYEIQEKNKNYNMIQPQTFLENVTIDNRFTLDKIFARLIKG